MKLKELKKGDWFTLKPIPEPKPSQVFIKDEYERSIRKYYALRFNDICSCRMLKGDTQVYTDFTFWKRGIKND